MEAILGDIRDINPRYAEYVRRQVRQLVTRPELSDLFGVTIDTIDAWVRKGCPVEQRGQGVESLYDFTSVAKWLAGQKVIKVGNDEAERLDRELKEEKLRSAVMERERKDGTLIRRADVEDVFARITADIRGRIKTFHQTYGDDAVEQLNEVIDDAVAGFEKGFDKIS